MSAIHFIILLYLLFAMLRNCLHKFNIWSSKHFRIPFHISINKSQLNIIILYVITWIWVNFGKSKNKFSHMKMELWILSKISEPKCITKIVLSSTLQSTEMMTMIPFNRSKFQTVQSEKHQLLQKITGPIRSLAQFKEIKTTQSTLLNFAYLHSSSLVSRIILPKILVLHEARY